MVRFYSVRESGITSLSALLAAVAELADALDSKSSGAIRAGSSPASGSERKNGCNTEQKINSGSSREPLLLFFHTTNIAYKYSINNLFGLNAADFSPGESADRFASCTCVRLPDRERLLKPDDTQVVE